MECEQADRNRSSIRQGDVIAAHPGTANWVDPFRRFFVVVSADCDIVNDKLETGLVVVPLIGLKTYAKQMWLPGHIKSLGQLLHRRCASNLVAVGLAHLTPEEWLSSSTDESEARVSALLGDESESLRKAARTLKKLQQASAELASAVAELDSAGAFSSVMARLASSKEIITGQTCTADRELQSGIATAGDPKRVDLWPLCDLIGLDSDMREDEADGFVAVFRYFERIGLNDVHVDKQAWLKDVQGYFRICRLRGIYKTDFLQRFANLFVRVGLDSSRDSEHEQGFERAAKRLLKEAK